jgi:hypothetical protein
MFPELDIHDKRIFTYQKLHKYTTYSTVHCLEKPVYIYCSNRQFIDNACVLRIVTESIAIKLIPFFRHC